METKKCYKCNEVKPLNMFSVKRHNKKDNFRGSNTVVYGMCKACNNAAAKEWRSKNPNYWKKYRDPSYKGKVTGYPEEDRPLMSAIRARLSGAKQNIRRRNWDVAVDITPDYLYELWKQQEGRCAYTNNDMLIEKQHPKSLSLDRIDPNKGYIDGNVQWVCWAVNRAKGDLHERDFLNMCKIITERCNDYPERE